MPETLLRTKLVVPPIRPNLVPRQRLIARLNEGLQPGQKLTLVAAPAGSGKTTLISNWIHQLNVPAAWLSLDEDDNEPHRFMFYVLAALRRACCELSETTIALTQSAQPPGLEALLRLLINDLDRQPGQVVLVLDDYHVISELEIHEAISFLLNNQPPQLHLVIIGRSDPAFPLHRLRGSGQIREVFLRDLRFTLEEVGSFFKETMGLDLPPADIAALERRTEGWVAGLQMAGLSMQGLVDPSGFVRDFAGDDRYISDYLIGEVFERQPAEVQDFLLKSAILERFCGPLCDAIMDLGKSEEQAEDRRERSSSSLIIERLDQGNLFTIPLDSKREWYRYHHLFADFLRLRLRSWPAERLAELHRRAAAWYEASELFAEAIDHALSGRDFQRASRLIELRATETLWGHTQWRTLVGWIEALPAEVVRSKPRLGMQYAWALFTTGRWLSVAPILNVIEAEIGADETGTASARRGEVLTLRAWLAFESDDMASCLSFALEAMDLLAEGTPTIKSLAILAAGAAQFWMGQRDEARGYLAEAVGVGLSSGNLAVVLVAIGCQVQMALSAGKLRQAASLYERVRTQGTVGGIALLSPVGASCVYMGDVLREWSQLQEADALLRQGVRLCRQAGNPECAVEGQLTLARVLWAAGKPQEAGQWMDRAEADLATWLEQGGDLRYRQVRPALIQRARYWLAVGHAERAAAWLKEDSIRYGEGYRVEADERFLLLARAFLAQGDPTRAAALLDSLLPLFEPGEDLRATVEATILRSLALKRLGDSAAALGAITRALRLAEPEGYLRIFLDEGKELLGLLEAAGQSGEATAYAARLAEAIQGQPRTGREAGQAGVRPGVGAVSPPGVNALAEPLTEREASVLRLIAAGRTSREIAAELFLSVNTIKTYTSRLYGKLGVHNRAEAVNRGHELGLI